MKNFIKAGGILFLLMTQLEAKHASNDLVLDNISAIVKVQQKPLPARWPTVVSGIIGVPLTAYGIYFLHQTFRGVPAVGSDKYNKLPLILQTIIEVNIKSLKAITIGSSIIGFLLISYMVKRIVDRHKARKALKMEGQQAYKKTQLVSSSVAHA